jgi:hypothetical protein
MIMTLPPLLPPVLQGEALRSFYARLEGMNRTNRLDLAKMCFGRTWAAADWVLPTNIGDFSRSVGVHLGEPDADYWIENHSLAPFYSATLKPKRQEKFHERLVHGSLGRRMPLVAFSMEEWFSPVARLCPACDEETQRSLGFSYVQRHWLLPYVTRCELHDEPLCDYTDWTPLECGAPRKREFVPGRQGGGLWLAHRSREVLANGQAMLDKLESLLVTRGYMLHSGRVRRQALVELIWQRAKSRIEHPELAWLFATQTNVARLLSPLGKKKSRCIRLSPFSS